MGGESVEGCIFIMQTSQRCVCEIIIFILNFFFSLEIMLPNLFSCSLQ